MLIIKPSVEIVLNDKPIDILKKIERCGRLCYQSEHRITSDSYIKFIKGIIARGHLSVIEHGIVTAIVVCDRGVTHEIVRHRLGSYSQESTRYVNYNNEMKFIEPSFWKDDVAKMEIWKLAMADAEKRYQAFIGLLATPEQARTVLPNSLATQIAMTYNLREWRHFFKVRCARDAHPQIREVAFMILHEMKNRIPIVFDDIESYEKK